MLEIKNLQVEFRNQKVLNGVDLSLKQGSIIGILGKNGAGKTTLFDTLYQNNSFSGNINWQGKSLKRSLVSYLETENYFYPYITGQEYLSYFSGQNESDVKEVTEKFHLPLEKYVQYYSSGMKKKLALIGMLMLDKPVNILDEPFNGVDFEGVHILYDIIKQLKSENKVVIISSHIIETLFHTCDKIAVLKNGRIEKIYEKEEFNGLNTLKF
ncbi:ATP-binding cassette domain-containing protein [Chryseobacterium carnipullorum]|uniref:ATP-binding cassette domain-containing protein n=1 Tax=Chryseobacterium carnipullorum TaxID=1124835 RepID=A0A376E273_CHRCU|nr:ATP-binding cassette domain-containing protein [Chryseobacterium carnipullorum]AZA50577.1 ATP-binding cassette domain-containing protein [Chryseobacterium carnipullorum]AZA65445.1 ATP-binding cassette domain-containing protein [Chryseobacterium carnipullorum]STD00619.1 Fe(3+) ions import ATP-binding protein FbpC [Chryseobacterium carnipullorum]